MEEKKEPMSAAEFQREMLKLAAEENRNGFDLSGYLRMMTAEKVQAAAEVVQPEPAGETELEKSALFDLDPQQTAIRQAYEDSFKNVTSSLNSDLAYARMERFKPLHVLHAFKEKHVRWAKIENGNVIIGDVKRPRQRMKKYDSYICLVEPKDLAIANDLDGGLMRTKIHDGNNLLFLAMHRLGKEIGSIVLFSGLQSLMERVDEKKQVKEGQQINSTYRVTLAACLAADFLNEGRFYAGVREYLEKRSLNNPEKVADYLLACNQNDLEELDPFICNDPCSNNRDRFMRNGICVWALFINSSKSEDREKYNFRSLPEDIYRAYRRFAYAKFRGGG